MSLKICKLHPNICYEESFSFESCPMCAADAGYVRLDKLREAQSDELKALRAKIKDLEAHASAQLESATK